MTGSNLVCVSDVTCLIGLIQSPLETPESTLQSSKWTYTPLIYRLSNKLQRQSLSAVQVSVDGPPLGCGGPF